MNKFNNCSTTTKPLQKAPKKFKYMQDIYDFFGSGAKLAAFLDIPGPTVEAWRRSGVPIKHWEKIIAKSGITPAELFFISERCRRAVTHPSKCK